MSLTFAAEPPGDTEDARTFAVICTHGGTVVAEAVGYLPACAEAAAHGLLCAGADCQVYGAEIRQTYAEGEPVPLNVYDTTGVALLTALGYPVDTTDPDTYRVMDADDFLARVILAQAWEPDETVVEVLHGVGLGVPTNLALLRTLGEACRDRGVRVVWG